MQKVVNDVIDVFTSEEWGYGKCVADFLVKHSHLLNKWDYGKNTAHWSITGEIILEITGLKHFSPLNEGRKIWNRDRYLISPVLML